MTALTSRLQPEPVVIQYAVGSTLAACLTIVATAAAQLPPSAPCPAPESRQFDFWIGSWNVLNRQSPPGNPAFFETGRATDRVYAAVGGCAIVEHWRGSTFQGRVLGFSVRAWDPEAQRWDLVLLWPSPGQPRFGSLHGTFRHGRGSFTTSFTTPAGDTTLSRFTFADVTPTSLRWESAQSTDGGSAWTSGWIMEFTRRELQETGLWNGPTIVTDRCPDDVHRAFDDRLGAWTGERTPRDGGEASDVHVHTTRILEGCATLERAWAADGSWESLRVRAYEPAADRWVQYAIATDAPVLRRWESAGPARPTAWTGADGSRLTVRSGPDGWGWVEQTRAGDGAPWKPVTGLLFTNRAGG